MRETTGQTRPRRRALHGGIALGALTVLLGLTGCASPAATVPGGNGAAGVTRTTRTPSNTGSGVDLLGVRRVVALGDSVTAGYGCDCDPFPDRIATALSDRSGHSVDAINDGVSGQTAHDLVDVLDADTGDEDVRSDVAGADIVLLTIGANDIADLEPEPQALSAASSATTAGAATGAATGPHAVAPAGVIDAATRQVVAATGTDLTRVVAQITALAPRAHVLVTGYWNLFPDGTEAAPDAAERAWTDAVTRAFNAELDRVAATGSVQVVDLYDPFKAGGRVDTAPLLLDDGDHPNARGHQVIADAILRALNF